MLLFKYNKIMSTFYLNIYTSWSCVYMIQPKTGRVAYVFNWGLFLTDYCSIILSLDEKNTIVGKQKLINLN